MEGEMIRRHAPVGTDLMDYLRANPSGAQGAEGVHLHVHHHYAAPEQPAAPVVPQRTVAERVVPYVWLVLGALIIGTVCMAMLAVLALSMIAVLAVVVILGLVVAYVLHSLGDSAEARGRAAEATARAAKLTRRK